MARLLGCLRRSILLDTLGNCVFSTLGKQALNYKPLITSGALTTRNYISEMRKSAFEGSILRLLRSEIQYELDDSPPDQSITKYGDYTVNDKPGELWINMRRKFGNEDIKIEASMFDGSVPAPNSGNGIGEEIKLHITMVVKIVKGGSDEALEIMCSAWPDSLEITKLFVHKNEKMSSDAYTGPEFQELDDDLQESLYDFLEERGINEDLTVFLHQYMKNKDKTEYIRWMGTVKSYIERT